MAFSSLPTPAVVRPVSSFSETLARCQMQLAMLYVSRAHIALARARESRLSGHSDAHAHLERAAHWRRCAGEWIAQAMRP